MVNFFLKFSLESKDGKLLHNGERGKLVVVEGMEFDAPKTKTITTLLNGLDKKKALIVVAEEGKNATLSVRNIPTARGVFANSINVYDILKYDNVILTKSAVAAIEEVYA